ncbi:hypothetical protein QJS10_CPA03g01368 [Acorus calamus]|uniref:Uncharacterized protein n=1 Tax=Acorus calamus TaxID=4465 RepID=A0AAV9F8W7_ACOCL|nr:hypothetical protein QJS10_CPA03g01368 [Acorus calamus]
MERYGRPQLPLSKGTIRKRWSNTVRLRFTGVGAIGSVEFGQKIVNEEESDEVLAVEMKYNEI